MSNNANSDNDAQPLLKKEDDKIDPEIEDKPIVHTESPERDFQIGILLEDNNLNLPEIVNYGKVITFPRARTSTTSTESTYARMLYYFGLKSLQQVPSHDGQLRTERNFLKKEFNSELNSWLIQQKQKSPAIMSIARQISRNQQASGTHSDELTSAEAEAGVFALLHEIGDTYHYTENGLYVEDEPILSRQLLRGEAVDDSLSGICPTDDIHLSRITQRVLRELLKSLEDIEVKKKWQREIQSEGTRSALPQHLNPIPEVNESTAASIPRGLQPESLDLSPRDSTLRNVPPEAFLLRHMDKCPMLRVPEDPVEAANTQPVIPMVSVDYGGQLGQWDSKATNNDRLGVLPAAWEKGAKKNIRVIFRLHVHQIVLTDHAMMSDEERLAIELKNSFVQYRNLFEQKLPEFFMYRLSTLIEQLSAEAKNAVDAAGSSSIDEYKLTRLYNELIETLPAMSDFSEELKKLTISLYKCWTDIRRIRLQQKAVLTPVVLSIRKVRSNLLDGENGDELSLHS